MKNLSATLVSLVLAAIGLSIGSVEAGEPYDMKKCLEEGRYCVDGDPQDIFDAVYDIRDPKKLCICQHHPPKSSLVSAEPLVEIDWIDAEERIEITIFSGREFDEVRLEAPEALGNILESTLPKGWQVKPPCADEGVIVQGPPTQELRIQVATLPGAEPPGPSVELRRTLWRSSASAETEEPEKTSKSEEMEDPGSDPAQLWELGTLQGGRKYPTTVTAKNASCRGRHTFDIEVEGGDWFQITGPKTLEKIKVGKSKTTEAVVDLRQAPPGDYRSRLLIRCLTCPPPPTCVQDLQVIDVLLTVVAPNAAEEEIQPRDG